VTGVDRAGVTLGEGERLAARTVLWGAGVAASPLGASLGVPLDRAGRVLVEPDLSIPGHPEIFVVGDLARVEQDGKLVPGVAPAAIQGGEHAARQILRGLRGQPREPFRYRDKGSMATIGRRRGVAELGGWRFSGLTAWLLWMGVHIFFLIGFPNRLRVMFEWAWAYLTYRRGSRLIFEGAARPEAWPTSSVPRSAGWPGPGSPSPGGSARR
jgi:NADH dehydrogenase